MGSGYAHGRETVPGSIVLTSIEWAKCPRTCQWKPTSTEILGLATYGRLYPSSFWAPVFYSVVFCRKLWRSLLCHNMLQSYSQVQDRSGVLKEMYKNVTVISRKMDLPQHAVQRWRHGDHRPIHSLFINWVRTDTQTHKSENSISANFTPFTWRQW